MQVRVLDQQINPSASFERVLLDLISDGSYQVFRALIAFVTLDGLLRLGCQEEGTLHSFTAGGRDLRWIIGTQAITTSHALNVVRGLATSLGSDVRVSTSTRLFHPKVFVFERPDGSGSVIVGSSNLTPGGLHTNVEAGVLLEQLSPEEIAPWLDLWDRASVMPDVYPVDDAIVEKLRVAQQADPVSRRRIRHSLSGFEPEPDLGQDEAGESPRVLLRHIARAGGRSSQVHLSRDAAERYFELHPGDGKTIDLQWVQPGRPPASVESDRHLVYSQHNSNPKIEMKGVRTLLPSNYPAGGRAILVVQEVGLHRFRYMVLLPGDDGYDEVNGFLTKRPRRGHSLHEATVTSHELQTLWPGYPA